MLPDDETADGQNDGSHTDLDLLQVPGSNPRSPAAEVSAPDGAEAGNEEAKAD